MQPNYILSRNDGHRLPNVMNRELDERMSYQTLLHLNEDLKTENIMLKDFGTRVKTQTNASGKH